MKYKEIVMNYSVIKELEDLKVKGEEYIKPYSQSFDNEECTKIIQGYLLTYCKEFYRADKYQNVLSISKDFEDNTSIDIKEKVLFDIPEIRVVFNLVANGEINFIRNLKVRGLTIMFISE